jgi:hypothetical protein
MSHALILNVRHGGAAAVPEGHVLIVRVVIIVEGPVGAEVHLHRLLWVLNRHAGADEDDASSCRMQRGVFLPEVREVVGFPRRDAVTG